MIVPYHDNVVVRVIKETKSPGGVVLPDTDSPEGGRVCAAEVVAVGPGRFEDGHFYKPPCKFGDKVLINDAWGEKFGDYTLIRASSVLGEVIGE